MNANDPSGEIKLKLLNIIRNLPEVDELYELDSKTEIYFNIIDQDSLNQIHDEYPDFFPDIKAPIYSVNVLSSKMMNNKGYKKFRYYLRATGEIIHKFEN